MKTANLKLKTPWLALLFAFGCSRAAESAQQVPGPPNFSSYGQSDSMRHYIEFHLGAARAADTNHVLAISGFPKNLQCAIQYEVTLGGQVSNWRECYGWAVQAHGGRQIPAQDLPQLTRAIRELPATNSTPPLDRLLIVSFNTGTNWVTRSYDRAALPPAMWTIFTLAGTRPEMRPE